MPELPEVEVQRKALVRWLKGRRVTAAEAESSRTFRGGQVDDFEALQGKLIRAERKGKYLLLTFEGNRGLLAHLGMTGKFLKRTPEETVPHSRARLRLDNGTVIHFRDPRLFGQLLPVAAQELRQLPAVAALGPDLLEEEPTPALLQEALGKTTQPLKVALMDQSKLAGLGNIHAAEALFRAKIHPSRKVATLTPAEWRRLSVGIHQALRYALDHEEGDEIVYVEEPGGPNPFLIYGRDGEKCRRCASPIQSFTQAGRTTYFCPKCQPAPKVGAASRRKISRRARPSRPRGSR